MRKSILLDEGPDKSKYISIWGVVFWSGIKIRPHLLLSHLPDGGDDVLMADQLLQPIWPVLLHPGQVCTLGGVAGMLLHIRHPLGLFLKY